MSRRHRRALVFSALNALLCALASNGAYAQQDNKAHSHEKGKVIVREGHVDRGARDSLMLLKDRRVRDELKLSPEQGIKLEEILLSARVDAMRVADRHERYEKTLDLGRAAERVLSHEQRIRLKEIGLHVQGLAAMTSPEVVKALDITDDQLEKLRAIRSRYHEQVKSVPNDGTLAPVERQRRLLDLRDQFLNEGVAVLTTPQREQFEKMRGKKFEIVQPPANGDSRRTRPSLSF
ncbi:MAG: hypothetical protein JW809_06485 [Pirellulales bacterium]|nr:hypothetical protein [Pirellulales bacterium]